MYSPLAYFLSKNLVETPGILLAPLLQLLILYWGLGYIEFFKVYLVMVLMANTAFSIGLMLSAISPNMNTATSASPLFNMPIVLFGGFITNDKSLASWISWCQWLSPIRYGNEAIAHTQMDHLHSPMPPFRHDLP